MRAIISSMLVAILLSSLLSFAPADEPQTYAHQCLHVKASEAVLVLKGILGESANKEPAYSLAFDGRTNTVLMTGPADRIAMAKKVLAKLDVGRQPLVCEMSPTLQNYRVADGKAEPLARALEAICAVSESFVRVRALGGNQILVFANPERHDAIAKLLAAFGMTEKQNK